ncbi:hypothetical protein [Nocardioides immobilis]|nr:hypothetical protein [Nocardioides immobilis]
MDRLGADDFSNLVLLRAAGVMGIVLGADGGYLAERLQAYAATGGLPV